MLGVRSVSGLAFYDWETTDLVRRIEISPKSVSNWMTGSATILLIRQTAIMTTHYKNNP